MHEKKLYRRLLDTRPLRFTVWANSEKNSGRINFDSVPGNHVYNLPKSVSFNEKRPRKPETNIQKRFEGMKSKFLPGIFQPGK